MTEDERKRAAQAVLAIPFFDVLLSEMEKSAVQQCINAQYNDHEKRQSAALEARAVQQIRQKLETLAKGQSESVRKAPA